MDDRIEAALIGFGTGVMKEKYQQIERTKMEEAELRRTENLENLKADIQFKNSPSGQVDQDGNPIIRRDVDGYQGKKMSQYDWNRQAKSQEALDTTANILAAKESEAGRKLTSAEQLRLDQVSGRKIKEQQAKDMSAQQKALAMKMVENDYKLAKELTAKDKPLTPKQKADFLLQFKEDEEAANESRGGWFGEDKLTEEQVDTNARNRLDKLEASIRTEGTREPVRDELTERRRIASMIENNADLSGEPSELVDQVRSVMVSRGWKPAADVTALAGEPVVGNVPADRPVLPKELEGKKIDDRWGKPVAVWKDKTHKDKKLTKLYKEHKKRLAAWEKAQKRKASAEKRRSFAEGFEAKVAL